MRVGGGVERRAPVRWRACCGRPELVNHFGRVVVSTYTGKRGVEKEMGSMYEENKKILSYLYILIYAIEESC